MSYRYVKPDRERFVDIAIMSITMPIIMSIIRRLVAVLINLIQVIIIFGRIRCAEWFQQYARMCILPLRHRLRNVTYNVTCFGCVDHVSIQSVRMHE